MSNTRLFKVAQFQDTKFPADGATGTSASLGPPPMGYRWEGTVQVLGQFAQPNLPDFSEGNEDWHVFLANEAWGVFFGQAVFGPIVITGNEQLTVSTENAVEASSYYSLVFIGNQVEDDGETPYVYPVAIPTTVEIGNNVGIVAASTLPVIDPGVPNTANIIDGLITHITTTVATTIITIPATRTWKGQITIQAMSMTTGNAGGATNKTTGIISVSGATAVPSGNVLRCTAASSQEASTTQGDVSTATVSTPFIVATGGHNTATIQLATTIGGINQAGEVNAIAIGQLI